MVPAAENVPAMIVPVSVMPPGLVLSVVVPAPPSLSRPEISSDAAVSPTAMAVPVVGAMVPASVRTPLSTMDTAEPALT